MRKLLSIIILLAFLVSVTSCTVFEVIEFTGENGEAYFYEYSEGIKSVTNYHPYKFWSLPEYQELVQYGEGAGIENDGVVYFIYILDTSKEVYYSAELDGETKEILFEEGNYFEDEAGKKAVIDRLVNVIDTAYFK